MSMFKLVWLNVWFYTLLVLFSLLAVPAMTLFIAVQAPFVSHRHVMRLFRKVIWWYGRVVIYVLPFPLVRVRYEDTAPANFPWPCLLICNHRSSSDPFLMAVLPMTDGVQVVNKWPFRLPLWGPLARLADYLSINEMQVEEFFAQAIDLLHAGVSIIAFPEGTRARTRDVGPFHGTLFRLALQEKVPIVPICISGSEQVPPRGSILLRPGRITLRRLPALTFADYGNLTPFQLKNKVHDMIDRELKTMESQT
jgi:1-acyl-sn-glycerol-3-phosphate acyltransferase